MQATEDLRELWRRIAFNVLISNTDDHLRNHGFLHVHAGSWTLSPAFDLNPNPAPGPKQVSNMIDGYDTAASIDTLVTVAGFFSSPKGTPPPRSQTCSPPVEAVLPWYSRRQARIAPPLLRACDVH